MEEQMKHLEFCIRNTMSLTPLMTAAVNKLELYVPMLISMGHKSEASEWAHEGHRPCCLVRGPDGELEQCFADCMATL